MNLEHLKVACLACVDDLRLSRETMEFQWILFDSRGLLGKPVSFGTKRALGDEKGLFGLEQDPQAEAIVIAIISGLASDILKAGLRQSVEWLKDPKTRERVICRLGEIGDAACAQAARVYDWARDHLVALLISLESSNESASDHTDADGSGKIRSD